MTVTKYYQLEESIHIHGINPQGQMAPHTMQGHHVYMCLPTILSFTRKVNLVT